MADEFSSNCPCCGEPLDQMGQTTIYGCPNGHKWQLRIKDTTVILVARKGCDKYPDGSEVTVDI
jgi:hypothetical protein